MAVLPMSISVKLLPPRICASYRKSRNLHCMAGAALATDTSTIRPRNLTQQIPGRNYFNTPTFPREVSLDPNKLDNAVDRAEDKVLQRLEVTVEMIRECEIKKFRDKLKGEAVSNEEIRMLVDRMSREIVNKFLEQPFRYLKSNDGKLTQEDKLKANDLLLADLQYSYSTTENNQ